MHNCSLSAKTDNAICARPLGATRKNNKTEHFKKYLTKGKFKEQF
jgi:hypothetical protein